MTGTYGDLAARIQDELVRTDLASQTLLEIQSAIRHYERQSFWFNEGQATSATVTATPNYAVPTDLLEIDNITITYSGHPYELHRRTWGWYRAIHGDDLNIGRSVPTDYTYFANQLWVYPVPDTVYVLSMGYIKQLPTLVNPTDTNEWMVGGEELIRSRAEQAVRTRYAGDPIAREERNMMVQSGKNFYSPEEEIAYISLVGTAISRLSSGSVMPSLS